MADPHMPPEPQPDPSARSDDLTAEELLRHAQEISALYPPPRLGTELVLLEVNPHRAHAYWNIDVEDFQNAVAQTGEDAPPMLLRVHDVTGVAFDGANSHSYFDVQVQGLQGHWYIDLWKDGRTYLAELGLRRSAGAFIPLARSNAVDTPRAAESPDYHTRAVDVAQPGRRNLDLVQASADPDLRPETVDVETGVPLDRNAPPVQPAPAALESDFHPAGLPAEECAPQTAAFVPHPAQPEAAEFPMAPIDGVSVSEPEADVEALFERADRPRVLPTPVPQPVVAPAQTPDEPPAAPPAEEAARREEVYAHWPTADELSRHVPDTSGAAPADIRPAEAAVSASDSRTVESPVSDSPAPVPAEPAAEQPAANPPPPPEPPPETAHVPLENYVKLTSYAEQRPQVALEVNVELHIYGRAKPGTQLSIYGMAVPLQPDGSFSIRKPLPHGAVVLPLLAVDPPQG